ncbi:TPA: hypothetical protein I8204_005651, partial [Raoultella ornithinolytica]|nr:hypothetical protein [Raoultella ornithinolytica]HAT2445470.1 hypothetical protein [Raoultella ornithinolytica]HBK6133844.1 hypothetical protein [Raoultella ornithinolytica]HEF9041690.1 hypothetical protein [Raoultella ornithinolytica]
QQGNQIKRLRNQRRRSLPESEFYHVYCGVSSMYLKKTISDNSGNTIVDAEHIIKELNISGGMLSFLLQSFAPSGDETERFPFRAAWYHCEYNSSVEVYRQAFEYLLTLDDFAGGEVVA